MMNVLTPRLSSALHQANNSWRAILYFSLLWLMLPSLALSQNAGGDELEVSAVAESVLSEYGYLDAEAFSNGVLALLQNRPLPSDADQVESGDCISQPEICGAGLRSSGLPGVRDIKLVYKNSGQSESEQNFKVKWKAPDLKGLSPNLQLSRYEVLVIQDGIRFQRYWIDPRTRADGRTVLPRRLRLFNQTPGNYTVNVRPYYQDGSARSADASFVKVADTVRADNLTELAGDWGDSKNTSVTPGTTLNQIQSLNPALYNCLTVFYPGGKKADGTEITLGEIAQINCPNRGITSLAGVEGFSALINLNLANSPMAPPGSLNQIDNINPLIAANDEPVSSILFHINLSYQNIASSGVGAGLYSSLNNHLHKIDSLRYLNLYNANMDRLPALRGPAVNGQPGSGLTLQGLNLSGNQLTAANLSGLAGKNVGAEVLHYLWLDHNPIGNALLTNASGPLAGLEQMISLSLIDVGLSGSLVGHGLPSILGLLHLNDNVGLTGFTFPTGKNLAYTYYFNGSSFYCQSVDSLAAWYQSPANSRPACVGEAPLGQQCLQITDVATPFRCAPNPPQGFTVNSSVELNQHAAHWLSQPDHWQANLHKVWYRDGRLGTPQSANSFDQDSVSFATNIPQSESYEFAIQACNYDDGILSPTVELCGPISAYGPPILAMQQPIELAASAIANNQFTLSWRYPSVPSAASYPDEFEISPLFPVVSNVPAPVSYASQVNGQWSVAVTNINEYPAGIVRVRACRGTGMQRECGEHAELSLVAPPSVTNEINPPGQPGLSPMGSTSQGEYMLSWPASTTPVDYYLVREQFSGRSYAVEETHMALKRYDSELVAFEIQACQRDRENGDHCSMPGMSVSNQNTVATAQSIQAPTGFCWFGDNQILNGAAAVTLYWEYPATNHVPQNFSVTHTGLTGLSPPGITTSGEFHTAYNNAHYDPVRNKWYWTYPVTAYASNSGPYATGNLSFASRSRRGNSVVNGATITPVRVLNGNAVYDESTRCATTPSVRSGGGLVGGPGELHPGHYSDDPKHRGNGWRFYWANELFRDEDHQAFGISYDLIGFWYTYKLFDGVWSPVWYFTRMQLVQSDSGSNYFEGALVYPRGGTREDLQVGTVRLLINDGSLINVGNSADNQNAWIEVNINHGDGMTGVLSHQIHDIVFDHPTLFNTTTTAVNIHDHYNGVWTPGPLFTDGEALANNPFYMVDWVERNLLSTGVSLFDNQGEPVWIASLVCSSNCNYNTSPVNQYHTWRSFTGVNSGSPVFTVYPGNNPLAEVPDEWGDVSEHRATVNGSFGRGHFTNDPAFNQLDTDFNQSQACVEVNFNLGNRAVAYDTNPGGGCNSPSGVTVNKVANLHGIDYSVAGDTAANTCHLGVNNPACEIRMTWFTDSDYPDVLPYYILSGQPLSAMRPLSQLCPAASNSNGPSIDQDYVVAEYRCNIDQAGNYTFLLVNPYQRQTSTGQPLTINNTIARSRPLNITGISPTNPGVAAVPDTAVDASTAHTVGLAHLQHDPSVGALAGEANVSGGSATYNISINVPPGRVGMQPAVGLSYSSRSGNGILGMGWSMSAGSSIHRCPQTIAQDGLSIGVTYQNSDRLCLDGQRLIHVGGGDYWASGSTYRTELDSFIEVTLVGSNADIDGSNAHFIVRTKSHRTMEYGTGTHSRVLPQPASGNPAVVSAWLLSNEQDPQSNRIDYRYAVFGAGEHLLDRIFYTGHSGSLGQREVRLSYSNRCVAGQCDMTESWSQGYRSQQTQALSEIRTCIHSNCGDGGAGLVREYDFGYALSEASGRLLLQQAQECATQDGVRHCLPATQFEWGDTAPEFEWGEWRVKHSPQGAPVKVVDRDPMVWSADAIGAQVSAAGDFDGDGIREIQISDGLTRQLVSIDADGLERWRVTDFAGASAATRASGAVNLINQYLNRAETTAEILRRLDLLDDFEGFGGSTERSAAMDEITTDVESEFILKALPPSAFQDLDNDGRVDFFGAVEDSANPGSYVLAFSHWKGIQGASGAVNDYFDLQLTNLPMTVLTTQGQAPYVVENPIWGDLTGDGVMDVLFYKSVTQTSCSQSGELEEAGAIELWLGQGYNPATQRHEFQRYNNGADGIIYIWPCTEFQNHDTRETASRPQLNDYNGDGVLDIAITSQINDLYFPLYNLGDVIIPRVVIPTGYQAATLRYLTPVVTGAQLSFSEQDLWAAAGAASLGLVSDPRLTYHLEPDVNGDGLNDYLFIANRNASDTLIDGAWYLQVFDGKRYLNPLPVSVPTELSISLKPHPRNLNAETSINVLVSPQYASLIKPADWNSDGRTDLLVPLSLERAICLVRRESSAMGSNNNSISGVYCPGSMDGTVAEPGVIDFNSPGDPGDHNVGGVHYMGFGGRDRSTYHMGVVELKYQPASNSYAFALNDSSLAEQQQLIANVYSQVGDINGDGIIDIMTPFGCQEVDSGQAQFLNQQTNTSCVTDAAFFIASVGGFPAVNYSEDFHCSLGGGNDGIDCGPNYINSKRGYYITQLKQARSEVLDLMLGMRDGLGNEAYWHYAPLSSSTPRPETDVPLYSVPNRDLGLDYLRNGERDHFYFESSMYVVSSLEQSNGLWENLVCDADLQALRGCALNSTVPVPLFNTTYYGYEEAVYNREGRGFQGFRKVVSENHVTNPSGMDSDSANDLRSVSIFHQIFPLAGQIEAMYTQAASEPYDPMQDRDTNPASSGYGGFKEPAKVLSLETMDYACRNGAGAYIADYCGINSANPSVGESAIPGVYQAVMTGMVQRQYEPTTNHLYVETTVSGKDYDAYGNMTDSTTESRQYSQSSLLMTITQQVNASYTNDPGTWWLGRLDAMHTTSTVLYPGMSIPGPLPTGMTGVSEAREMSQAWFYNALRQPICQYTYEGDNAPANWSCDASERMSQTGGQATRMVSRFDIYGNPIEVSVDGSLLDEQRKTSTTYGTAGYFLDSMINAAGHTVHSHVEAREGNTLSVQDANGWLTMTRYDAFGRMIQRWSPTGANVDFDQLGQPGAYQHYAPRAKMVYAKGAACGSLPLAAQYCQWAIADGAPVVWQALDSQNRIVESRSYGYQGTDQNPRWVYSAQRYNGRGQVVAETIPAYSTVSSVQSEYHYDVLGRQTLKASPSSDASVPTLYTHYQHRGLTTTIQVGAAALPAESCLPANPNPDSGVGLTSSSQICVSRTYASNGWLLKTVDAHGSQSRFWYDGQGNSKLIADPADNLTGANYNHFGQRTDLFDPNLGHWQFSYNGLSELLLLTDAKGQQTTYNYDALGRRTLRVATNVSDPELSGMVDRWFYDPLNGNGLLDAEQREVALADGTVVVSYARQYAYDAYNRPAGYQLYLDPHYYQGTGPANTAVLSTPGVYQVGMEYDAYFGRVKSITYPQDRLRLYQAYESNGYLSHEGDSQNQAMASAFRRIKTMNAAGQVTEEEYGNGMRQFFDYNPRNFQMAATWLQSASGTTSHYEYDYDVFGNLVTQSKDHGATASEDFKYDHLHRLTQSNRQLSNGGSQAIQYRYDALGNLTAKSDFGSSYHYFANNKPNAVRSVVLAGGQGATYQYDLNGNLTAGDSANPLVGELRVHYDAYNKPFRTQRNGHFSEFWYGADDQRYFQRDSQGLETVYVGKLYEQKGPTKHQLYLGGYAVFTVDITDPSATGLTYLHGDRLGSVVDMSNASGQLINDGARGFDPFGKPREGDWSNSNHNDAAGGSVLLPNDLNRPDLTTRGFTGHEQLNNVALTHMNGRAYDYNLGRFLSVDPVIQFPANSQSLNPYSYILNNPLAGTDPTGYVLSCPTGALVTMCLSDRPPSGKIHDPIAEGCVMLACLVAAFNGNVGQSMQNMDESEPDRLMAVDERDSEGNGVCDDPSSASCKWAITRDVTYLTFTSVIDKFIHVNEVPGNLYRGFFSTDQYSYDNLSSVCEGSCDNNGLPEGVVESLEIYTAGVLAPYGAGALPEGMAVPGYRGMAGTAARQAARQGSRNSTTLTQFGSSLDDLSNAASQPFKDTGLTVAARALDKHAVGQREGASPFPRLSGNTAARNEQARQVVSEILNNPMSEFTILGRGGLQIRSPNGQGMRFNQDGSLSGFVVLE